MSLPIPHRLQNFLQVCLAIVWFLHSAKGPANVAQFGRASTHEVGTVVVTVTENIYNNLPFNKPMDHWS